MKLTRTERAVAAAFTTGDQVDVRNSPVRGEALRFILLGGVLSLVGATLNGSGGGTGRPAEVAQGGFDGHLWVTSVAFSSRGLTVREMALLPGRRPGGVVDPRHACTARPAGTTTPGPCCWPANGAGA